MLDLLLNNECFALTETTMHKKYIDDMYQHRDTCQAFVETTQQYMPEFKSRLKVHILLHLVDCMAEFGPASCFNTER